MRCSTNPSSDQLQISECQSTEANQTSQQLNPESESPLLRDNSSSESEQKLSGKVGETTKPKVSENRWIGVMNWRLLHTCEWIKKGWDLRKLQSHGH